MSKYFQANKAYDEMIFLIAHVLNEIQNGPVSRAYAGLVQACRDTDLLITFNWDTLLDRALRETGQWDPDTGYEVLFESVLDGEWREPKASASGGHHPRLLKLHGSTNWLVNYVSRNLTTGDREMVTSGEKPGYVMISLEPNLERTADWFTMNPVIQQKRRFSVPVPDASHPDARPVCILEANKPCATYRDRYRPDYKPFSYFFPPDHPRTGIPLMPLVVPPTSFKLYEEFAHVIDPLWSYASQGLAQADKIVIVGYSIPPTDTRTIALLRGAFNGRSPAEVEIVDPNAAQVRDRLIDVVGAPESKVTVRAQAFDEYVDTLA